MKYQFLWFVCQLYGIDATADARDFFKYNLRRSLKEQRMYRLIGMIWMLLYIYNSIEFKLIAKPTFLPLLCFAGSHLAE